MNNNYRYIGKSVVRDDALGKANGSLKFFGDLCPDNCLHGAIHRAAYPHAKIINIDISEALKAPGVVDVLTWKDIPGKNAFGIGGLDQPVLCQDKCRFIGDPIAVVIAEDEKAAQSAKDLVKVEYEELPLINDVLKARKEGAEPVQINGNIGSHFTWKTGDVNQYFTEQYVVVENEYKTQYQEHAYLETEVGIADITQDGGIEIWAPAQYPYRDIWQLSMILNIPQEKIHCHASPLGGGFGGKDDMHVQPLCAVASWKLRRKVRIQLNREESFLYSTKRVPFKFHMITAADHEGNLLAHKVETFGDVGPFTGISVAVFNYGVENCCGAYYFPNIDVLGEAIYTNNAHTGSFRGFGNNQLNWGLEMQLDEIADKIGMDRIDLRIKNLTQTGKRLSYGHIHEGCDGLIESFKAAKNSWLWTHQEEFKKAVAHPWLKRGIGVASGQHGNGLGNALKDEGEVRIELNRDGIFTFYLAMVDMGQGLMTSAHIIAADSMDISYDQVRIVLGETDFSPDAGPTTASRSTYVSGNAIYDASQKFKSNIIKFLNNRFDKVENTEGGLLCDGRIFSWKHIYPLLEENLRKCTGKCVVPVTDLHIQIGLHCMHTHVTQVSGVEVNTLTGKVDVIATEIFPAAGTMINKLGYEGQCEGGIAMAMGYAIMEEYKMGKDCRPITNNLQTYMIPTIKDIPHNISINPIENEERSGPFGAKGLGEPVTIPGAPAITNAICDAVGIKVNELPASPERVLALMENMVS